MDVQGDDRDDLEGKRRFWARLFWLGGGVAGALAFVANIGGARDTVCGFGLEQVCAELGLSGLEARERAETLRLIEGRWGLADRPCSETVAFRVERTEEGVFITSRWSDGIVDHQQVAANDNGVVFSRGVMSNPDGSRPQWEFRPEGARLSVTDKDGRTSVLVRCEQ